MRPFEFMRWPLAALIAVLMSAQSLAASPVAGPRIDDPLLRAAQFDLLVGEPFAAITHLQADLVQGRVARRANQTQWVLGSMYLANGAHFKAATIFESLAKNARLQSVRNQAWLNLAQVQFRRGQPVAALVSLRRIRGELPSPAQQERLLLSATLLMQQKKFAAAVHELRQLGQESLLQQLNEKSLWPTYGRFNLGVALFRQGEEQEGRQLLEELGSMAADNEEDRALRDKANLTLAYHYLDKKQPEKAQQYFFKTRLQGPMSSRALLGLGRAYSAVGLDKKALVPWLKLSKMDASDPAVQDGLLAVPFAFGKLEAFKQALEYYQLALERYKAELEQVAAAETAVSSGALVDRLAKVIATQTADERGLVQDLPNTPGGRYLWQLFATHEFQETLKNYAQLRLSLQRLESWVSPIANSKGMLSARRKGLEKRLRELQGGLLSMRDRVQSHLKLLAQEALAQRKQRLLGYAGEARFSMAQIYDYAAKRWGDGQ